MTTQDFIRKAKEVHGDKYIYDNTAYTNSITNVVITCPVHGNFEQNPNSHLKGCGCKSCADEARRKNKITKDEFIKLASEQFANKYDYSKVEFIDEYSQVRVICPEHGEFYVSPKYHLHGKTCPKCANVAYNKNHKCDKDQFVDKSIQLYGDKFDYSKVEYVNSQTEVTIVCPEHGEFNILPSYHLKIKGGCPQCSKETRRHKRSMTTDEYKLKVIEQHGDKYDLTRTVYTSMHNKVVATCSIHGDFEINAYSFTHGHGCPTCGIYQRAQNGMKNKKISNTRTSITNEVFIERSRLQHGNKYDYSKVDVSQTKVTIICPKHGEFEQNKQSHMRGIGCPMCAKEKRLKEQKITTEKFIEKAKKVHGNKYDYSQVVYDGCYDTIRIICPEHGEFLQQAYVHTSGHGCPKCMAKNNSVKLTYTTEEFIEAAKKVYGGKYDYSEVKYVDSHTDVIITCDKGHRFYQKPYKHLNGYGCACCCNNISKPELAIVDFLKNSLNEQVITNNRNLLPSGKELDIYLPDKKIAIEFDGLYWHSEEKKPDKRYHLNKTEECTDNGIRLLHIFEDEWKTKPDIVKSRLAQILGHTSRKIYARECEIKDVDSKTCVNFLNENHIQGSAVSLIRLGLYHKNELVAIMSFCSPRANLNSRKKNKDEYELVRFCPKINTSVIGGASKLLSHFIKEYNPIAIVSYADRRWSNGSLYEKLGFILDHISEPSYFYVVNDERRGRFMYRKDVLVAMGYDRNKTEHQIMLDRGIYRIYDCGCLCYKWVRNNVSKHN